MVEPTTGNRKLARLKDNNMRLKDRDQMSNQSLPLTPKEMMTKKLFLTSKKHHGTSWHGSQ